MAEFKLGRIRFVWRGTWTPGAAYLVDDVIGNGGKSYICVVNHTASPEFGTDLEALPTKWNLVADGTQWAGDWEPETYYNPGAIVKYGALVYICKNGHTSATYESPTYLGLEDNINDWEVFATSFNWVGSWNTSTRYRENDFVVYGGSTYVCKEGHISDASITAGLEIDADKWDIFNNGVTYLGDWSGASVRYKENDLAKFGANLWICTEYHTSSATFDESKWDIFVNGFEFENSWNNSEVYQPGDTVTYGGYSYISKTNNTNKQPTSNPTDWDVFTTGFKFVGEWNNLTNYLVGNVVRQGAYTYVALLDNIGQNLTNTTYWSLLNTGFRWTNTPQTYTAVASVAITGLGQNARFNVTRSGTVYSVTVAPGQAGIDYVPGDKVKVLGSLVGGITPANDITITVGTVSGGAISTITWKGGSVTWTSGTNYLFGDVVSFGANSYVCVERHTAASGNRPDNDTTGTYWNLIAAGSEFNILTETGDLVYFGSNGPTRLPVGTNGQVLRSQDGFPVWANYGLINNLVYVGPLGRDFPYPEAGATIDQPWRSVKFAAKQIEDGYLNPQAKELLAMNKQFIMKEITNWVIFTYTVNITGADAASDTFTCTTTENLVLNMPIEFSGTVGGVTAGQVYYVKAIISDTTFTISATSGGNVVQLSDSSSTMTGTLSYDHEFCERDVGLIVEAIKYDVSHGGNAKTTAAARAYYTPAGNQYINSNFGAQTVQTIAAYTYLGTLLGKVLTNTPWVSYQAANGIANGVTQSLDTGLEVETGVLTQVNNLISLITTGIEVGSVTGIPAAINSNTTISIKTGTYDEVLPIVIPENTALVGDELRSTVIQPKQANDLLVNDVPKSTAALTHISSLIPNMLQNIAVSPTSGNNEVQKYINGYVGSSVVTTAVENRSSIISDILNNGLGSVPSVVLTDPTSGVGNAFESGYFNARRLIVANKNFLIEEISAWISAQIAANTAPFAGFTYIGPKQTSCERDIGYQIDAIAYDLTYGGNIGTTAAARSYFTGNTFLGTGDSAQVLAIQTYLKSIIGYIVEADNTSWTPVVNPIVATQDDSGTPGSAAAATFAEERVQDIYDTVDNSAVPATIEPSVSWVNTNLVSAKNAIQILKEGTKSGVVAYINGLYPTLTFDETICKVDVGHIVDAISYDIMLGSNFLSSKAGISYYIALDSSIEVLTDDVPSSLDAITFIETAISQVTNGQKGSVGSITAVERIESRADTIYDIVASGLGSVPTLLLPDPTGYGSSLVDTAYAATGNTTGATTSYGDARTQIFQNTAFIQAEIAAFLNVNYNSVWVGLGPTGQAGCARDIAYILSGVRYDITYGGNSQSLIVGSAYYSNFNSTIDPGEITATVAAYTRLKTIIGQIAQKQSVTPTAGNTTPQVVSGTAGNAASAAFAQARLQDIIDWVDDGVSPAAIAPATAWASTELKASFAALQDKKAEIQSDVLWWVYKNHQDLNFNAELCTRDTGYMVDALSYDMLTGSNFASITAGRSLRRATDSAQRVVTEQLEAELGSINFLKYKAKHIAAVGAVAKTQTIISDIVGFINGGSIPRVQWNNPPTINSGYAAATVLLTDNKEFIKSEIIAWINNQIATTQTGFVGLEYNSELCARDVDYVLDALRYDLTYGYGVGGTTNYATRQAALAYFSGLTEVLQIDPNDKTATIAAYNRLKTVVQAVVQDNAVTPTTGNTATQVRAAAGQTVGSAASATSLGTLVDVITTTVNDINNVPAEVVPVTAWVPVALSAKNAALQSNKSIIVAAITAYIAEKYPTLVYDQVTCERDVGLIIDAVGYDMMFESNYLTIVAARSYFRSQAAQVLLTQRKATIASFRELKTQLLTVIGDNDTARRRVKTLMDIVINTLINGIGSTSEVTGTVTYNNDASVFNGAEILRLNREFLAEEATAYINASYGGTVTSVTGSTNTFTTSAVHNLTVGDPIVFTGTVITGSNVITGTTYYVLATPTTSTFKITDNPVTQVEYDVASNGTGSMNVRYLIDSESYKKDIRHYIDSIIYDLGYTGNYKSLRIAELYINSVNGSHLANMFYVSNATGLRNCTLNGLNGELTEENDFGTKRPTAGAYVALNPGFGPNDSNVWVKARSHYSQNVTMFGTGCSGAKIDGAIHAGGNRSMVKNDFTTIISDGIGVWCTGANSLTELVSVFNYYGYAGYLAELGGRIRATNGNSSYGTYGVIAEGTDTYEQPIFAVLDNHAQEAFSNEVITDGVNAVWRIEYNNAGTNYTNATIQVGGAGVNAQVVADEIRDAALFETRLIDLNDGNGFGGTNYQTSINAAQGGDKTSITIANSDVALSTAYPTMRIQLTAGSGVGQYGNILTYNNGTKVAQVYKDSFEPLSVTSTTDAGDLITTSSNATLYVNMPVYFSGTAFGNIVANRLYYIKTLNGTTNFTISETEGGTTLNVSSDAGSMTLLAAGWDHVIPGFAISNSLDLTTSYIIEPRINYSHPGYTATARTLATSAAWREATYGNNKYVAIAGSGTTTNFSLDGKTWTAGGALSASASWIDVVYGGGEGASATAVVGGLGGDGAVLQAVMGVTNSIGNPGPDQVVAVNIIDGGYNYTTAPTIVFTPVSGGLGATATCTVLNGKIDTVTVTINGSGYNQPPTVTAATDRVSKVIINSWGKNYGNGSTTVTFTGGGSTNQATGNPIFDNGGIRSIEIGNSGGSGYTSTPTVTIVDTNAKFVAVASGTINTSYLSATDANNAAWTAGGTLPAGFTTAASIAFGNGVWVVVGGTATAASSTTATGWVPRTLPTTTGTWSSVSYGAGRFVAISTGSQATAYSTNGQTWVAGGNLPSSTTWTSVAYGNGRWVAIASGGRTTAYSLDNGLNWTAATPGLPSSQTWVNIKYAQGIFVAIANASTVCAVSSDGINWYSRTMPGSSTNWSGVAFGNVNNNPLWVAISATSGTTAASINTGARALGRMKALSGELLEVRVIEPGSGYSKGTVTATTDTTNLITADNTINLVDQQPVIFSGLDDYGLETEKVYYVIGATITSTQFKVSLVAGSGTPVVLTTGTGLSGIYRASPIVTQFDPNKVVTAALTPRTNDGVLGNPTFTNRGTGYTTATTSVVGDGFADLYQPSTFVAVRNLYQVPQAGSNVEFASIPGVWYKLVAVTNVLGEPGNYTANFQISPGLSVLNAPKDADPITTTIKYSQVRLTGHDFLYIGTGNQADTNYPFVDPTAASIAAQTNSSGGGRVFFTSTDQDGNFNVGNLFGVQQSTGTATLNADAFNLSGLQSLQLTGLAVGTGSAVINQFSTDPFFTADSDNIVPTQRAIKAYITAQIGGGQSSLNVNTLTSGVIYVANDSISTTSGGQINIKSKMNFTGGIDGAPVALGFFFQR